MKDRVQAPLPIGWCLGVGVLSAVVGLLPWIVTGMRLPVQNLWEVEVDPATMPRALLPLSNYYLVYVAALLVVGGGIAGLVARVRAPRMTRRRVLAVVVGVLVVQVLAIAQAATTLRGGLEDSRASTLYLQVILAAAVLSGATAALVTILIATSARPANVIGLAIAAVLAASWLSGLVFPPGSLPKPGDEFWQAMVPWVAPVLVGAAIAWGGVDTAGRVTAAVVALIGLWLGPALITAISSAAGSRVLARYPSELIAYATEVFRAALTTPSFVLRPLAVAVIVAVLGLVISRLVRRPARPATRS